MDSRYHQIGIRVNNQAEKLAALYFLNRKTNISISEIVLSSTLKEPDLEFNIVGLHYGNLISAWYEYACKDITIIPFADIHNIDSYLNKIVIKEESKTQPQTQPPIPTTTPAPPLPPTPTIPSSTNSNPVPIQLNMINSLFHSFNSKDPGSESLIFNSSFLKCSTIKDTDCDEESYERQSLILNHFGTSITINLMNPIITPESLRELADKLDDLHKKNYK